MVLSLFKIRRVSIYSVLLLLFLVFWSGISHAGKRSSGISLERFFESFECEIIEKNSKRNSKIANNFSPSVYEINKISLHKFYRAANKMDPYALTTLAILLMQSDQSFNRGLEIYKCAADQRNPEALFEMAKLYRDVVEDYNMASHYFRQAMIEGNRDIWWQYRDFLQERRYGFYLDMDHSVIQRIYMSRTISDQSPKHLSRVLLEPTHPLMGNDIAIPLQRNEDLLDRMIYAKLHNVDWREVEPSFEVYQAGKQWRDQLEKRDDSEKSVSKDEQIKITPYAAFDSSRGYINESYTVYTDCESDEDGGMNGCLWYYAGFTDNNGDAYFNPKEGVTRYTLQMSNGFTYEHYVLEEPVTTVEDKVLLIRNLNRYKSGSDEEIIRQWQGQAGYEITGDKDDLKGVEIVDPYAQKEGMINR